MRIHWTQTKVARKEIQTLTDEDSRVLLDQLLARIARRDGRFRRRVRDEWSTGDDARPTLPEAA
ncbi:MAG: hypothetical protein GY854_11990 [Deltaproteobacteria bacterium]|nr:hypothetical protein [Deltaproteobacteria bacterium]